MTEAALLTLHRLPWPRSATEEPLLYHPSLPPKVAHHLVKAKPPSCCTWHPFSEPESVHIAERHSDFFS